MKKLLASLMSVFFAMTLFATNPPDEGMWLPMFIKDYNYADMQRLGLRMTPEQMYDINNSSLKDAIVQLGNFCTAEIISKDGLVLTNHHCGYSAIADHSTEEHDYLKYGFWAMNKQEELPNEGLTVTFLIRMADVTRDVLKNVTPDMTETKRRDEISKMIQTLKKENNDNGKYTVEIKPFYEGNEYYMFIYLTYRDVRLVGAPPSGIGKFGGDTDNWMWPRHTGDFSIFRVYTAPDGSPADYSPNNVPLKPKYHLPISLKGIEKGDYSMIWGYPGTTNRFMTSFEIDNQIKVLNPPLIEACDVLLPVIRDAMNANDRVRIAYADHFAGLANMWKNKKGETQSLISLRVADKKAQQEKAITEWIGKDNARMEKYGNALTEIREICEGVDPVKMKAFWYANISLITSKTLFLPYQLQGVKPKDKKDKYSQEKIDKLLSEYRKLMENTDPATEAKLVEASLKLWKELPQDIRPDIQPYIDKNYKGDEVAFSKAIVNQSIYGSEANFKKFLENPNLKKYENDPLVRYFNAVFKLIMYSQGAYLEYDAKLEVPRRSYIAAIQEMEKDHPMYPDANFTMRVTYGQVLDYYPTDGVHYLYYTTDQGILEKEIPGDPEFDVPAKLKELILKKDFGKYGIDGSLPVCFLSNNDITGGNSGSPVLNANGEVIGVAFDGNWEALSSDIVFNTELQRCINVDIRYVMFVIDKFAGAGYLFDEMTIIE